MQHTLTNIAKKKVLIRNASTTGSSVSLDLPRTHKRLCYMIAANDGTTKVNISGMYAQQTGNKYYYIMHVPGDFYSY